MSGTLTANKLLVRVIIACAVMIISIAACTMIGAEKVSLSNALSADQTGNTDFAILFQIRLPRILLAAIVGAALAASGVVFQALLRNPLAEPYILGISSGAGLGAILAAMVPLNLALVQSEQLKLLIEGSKIGAFVFAAAMGTVWLVWIIGRVAGRTSVTGLLLAGVVVNAFFSSLIMFLNSVCKSDKVFSTMFWLMGNMQEQPPVVLWISAGFIIAGIAALYFIAPELNAISFSTDDAKSMGINTLKVEIIGFCVTSLITAIAVSLSGLIGFVGLIIPHAIRLVLGPDHRQLVLLSAIYGGVFLIVADTFARVIVAPAQLPVGVVTSLIGGPFFLILLVKFTRKAQL